MRSDRTEERLVASKKRRRRPFHSVTSLNALETHSRRTRTRATRRRGHALRRRWPLLTNIPCRISLRFRQLALTAVANSGHYPLRARPHRAGAPRGRVGALAAERAVTRPPRGGTRPRLGGTDLFCREVGVAAQRLFVVL